MINYNDINDIKDIQSLIKEAKLLEGKTLGEIHYSIKDTDRLIVEFLLKESNSSLPEFNIDNEYIEYVDKMKSGLSN